MNGTKPNPELARVFEETRHRAGLSIFKVAARTGLHPNTIARIGYGIASARTLIAVSRILEVSVDELTGRKPLPVTR